MVSKSEFVVPFPRLARQTPLDEGIHARWSRDDVGTYDAWYQTLYCPSRTVQLILNGPKGYLVGGWNYPIDSHLTHVLVDLEKELSQTLQRHIVCTIVDGEAGGLPIGERYAEAGRSYISVLSGQHNHRLAEFVLNGGWAPVVDDPNREAVFASWADPEKASRDPRQFILLRPIGQTEPTRIYTALLFDPMPAAVVPWLHRRRWPYNELRIRELINGANLNENYGYTYDQVPHRTRQREWEKAQAKVEVTQRKLSQHREAIHNLRHQLKQLQGNYDQQCVVLKPRIVEQRRELRQRQQLAQPTKRCHNCLQRLRKERVDCKTRFLKRQRRLLLSLHRHRTHSHHLRRQLAERIAARDAIDTETLCRERHLEKDQIMLNFQVLLGNLHDWVKQHYFAPQWRRLTLDKATKMIYRKSGRVTWYQDRINVVLDPYAYHDQQLAMEATCRRFNAAHLRWRDGRLLRITVQPRD